MASKLGPKIINNGLVVSLDAADVKSYAGEPTTNLISNGGFENNTTSGWSFDPKTTGSFSVTSDDKKSGLYSAKLTNSTSSAIALWKSISITSGQQYTISAWIKNVSCPTTPYFSVSSGGTFNGTSSGSSTTGVTAGSDWVYISKTFTATNTQTTNPYIRTSYSSTQGYFLVDDFQIENKTYSTPFANTTRSTTDGWKDLSTNDHDGSLINGTGTGTTHYRDGQVIMPLTSAYLEFDGTDNYVSTSFGNGHNPATNPISYTVWVKTHTNSGNKMFLVQSDWGGNHRAYFGTIGGVCGMGIQSSGWSSSDGGDTITTNTWNHMCIVFEGSTCKWYRNGNLMFSKSYTSFTFRQNLSIGAGRPYSNSYDWNGEIAQVLVNNKSLTAAEVLNNYNTTKSRFS